MPVLRGVIRHASCMLYSVITDTLYKVCGYGPAATHVFTFDGTYCDTPFCFTKSALSSNTL